MKVRRRSRTGPPCTLQISHGRCVGGTYRHLPSLTCARAISNTTAEHVKEIFGHFGRVAKVELVTDPKVGLPRVRVSSSAVCWTLSLTTVPLLQGFAYVDFYTKKDAQEAQLHMDNVRAHPTCQYGGRGASMAWVRLPMSSPLISELVVRVCRAKWIVANCA